MTVPDLQRLFSAGPYSKPGAPRGWRFWLPLIGLFEGMRFAEILGLRRQDVAERDGVPVFIVRPNACRSLKTVQSARDVPVHSQLQALGFLGWAARRPADAPLFPDLPAGERGPLNAAQKAMGRWFRSVFPDDSALVFHSLRHTWTDAARNAYVRPDILERLGGWKSPGASAMFGYGEGYRPSVLAQELEKVVFPDLDLRPLEPKPTSETGGGS